MRSLKISPRIVFKPSIELLEDRNSPVNAAISSAMISLTNSDLLSDRATKNTSVTVGSVSKISDFAENIKNITFAQAILGIPQNKESHATASDNFFGSDAENTLAFDSELETLTHFVQFSGSLTLPDIGNNPVSNLLMTTLTGGDTGGGTVGTGGGGTVGGTNPPPDYVEQVVDWNMDNDNSSAWLSEGIPSTRDYDVGFTPTEDEVLPLALVANPASGNDALIPKHVEWKLQISQTGEGIIKIWDSPAKLHQLSPSDTWQFTPNPFPISPQEGIIPTPFIEGVHLSSVERDIKINWSVKTDYWNAPTTITTFKQVQVTVGPLVQEMKVTKNLKPYFDNNDTVLPDGDGRAANVEAYVEFTSKVKKGNASTVGYIQYVNEINNLLENNTTCLKYVTGLKNGFTRLTMQQQIAAGLTGSKYELPAIDTNAKGDKRPWYPTASTPLANGVTQLKMEDLPSMPINIAVGAIGFKFVYTTFVAYSLTSTDKNTQVKKDTYSSLTKIKWTVQYTFGGWKDQLGLTKNYSDDNKIEPANGWDKVGPNELYGGLDGNTAKEIYPIKEV